MRFASDISDGWSAKCAGQAEQPQEPSPLTIALPAAIDVVTVRVLVVFVSSIILPSCKLSRARWGQIRSIAWRRFSHDADLAKALAFAEQLSSPGVLLNVAVIGDQRTNREVNHPLG